MPSKKGQKRLEHEDIRLNILQAKPSSQRPSKPQSKPRPDSRIPKAVHFHSLELQEQLDYAYHAGKGQKGVTRNLVQHFREPLEHLYAGLPPEIDYGPIAAAASQVQKAMQHHDDKRARRIKAFRDELPPPFNKYTNIDPGLAISVPVNDPKPAAILRELGAIRLLHKVREALHEAHWWFGEDGFISWVIAVRQLPAGHLEVFTDSAHHHDVLVEHSAWQTVFLEKLVEESCTYGVSVVGLPAASVRKFPQDDVRKQRLVQQLFDWNRSRIRSLQGTQGVLSIEIRRTNRGNAIVVVNLAQPAIANEFISTGIQWDGTTYSGRSAVPVTNSGDKSQEGEDGTALRENIKSKVKPHHQNQQTVLLSPEPPPAITAEPGNPRYRHPKDQ